ncbi:MAG: cytidylyltransferase domain-containing protein [Bacteroidota bacterium]
MSIVAIIPARGGSKGVKGKNIRPFLGKPLIVHSIEQALRVPLIDGVYVSTDNDVIGNISESAGAEVIARPAEISGDTASSESAIEHAINFLSKTGKEPQTVVFLQATSPVRPPNAISDGLSIFIKGHYDSLLSLSPTHRFFWKLRGDEAVAEYDFLNRPRRQDITPENCRYVENGSLYIFSKDLFQKTSNRLGGRIGYIIFNEEYSCEIDTETDFQILEKLAETIEKNG